MVVHLNMGRKEMRVENHTETEFHVWRKFSRTQCEASRSCNQPIAVNIVTLDADIWFCAVHAAMLAARVNAALALSCHQNEAILVEDSEKSED